MSNPKPATKPRKKFKLGGYAPTNAEDLEKLAQISDADIVKAQEHWRAHAPAKMKRLLDAVK